MLDRAIDWTAIFMLFCGLMAMATGEVAGLGF